MRLFPLSVFAAFCIAQESPSVFVMTGDILETEGTSAAGTLSIRSRDHRVHRCTSTTQTWFDRDGKKVEFESAINGMRVEAVAERTPQSNCTLRTVHLFAAVRPMTSSSTSIRLPRRTAMVDILAPRGNLTYSGIVLQRTPEMLVLRTRGDGNKTFVLRQDTRYLESGLPVENANLAVNTRVFVRAGRNFENELEVFQIIWGDILNVR